MRSKTTIEELWKAAVNSLEPLTDRIFMLDTEVMLLTRPTTVEPEEIQLLIEGDDVAVWLATVKYKERLEAYLTKEFGGIDCVLIGNAM